MVEYKEDDELQTEQDEMARNLDRHSYRYDENLGDLHTYLQTQYIPLRNRSSRYDGSSILQIHPAHANLASILDSRVIQ